MRQIFCCLCYWLLSLICIFVLGRPFRIPAILQTNKKKRKKTPEKQPLVPISQFISTACKWSYTLEVVITTLHVACLFPIYIYLYLYISIHCQYYMLLIYYLEDWWILSFSLIQAIAEYIWVKDRFCSGKLILFSLYKNWNAKVAKISKAIKPYIFQFILIHQSSQRIL